MASFMPAEPQSQRVPMSFNLDKCHVMAFGRSQWHHSYTMMNADGVPFPLQRCYEEQDWGYCLLPTLNLVNISVR